jgi:peroxin-2
VPYLYNRLRTHALSRAWPDTPSSDTRRMAWQILTRLESTHLLLSLLNFVVFLLNGRQVTVFLSWTLELDTLRQASQLV